MSDTELELLGEDIKANGQRYPILVLDGMILDGRNRWLACERKKLKPQTEEFSGDAMALVRSLNIERRHLSESQRGMVAARLANMPEGRPENNCLNSGSLISQAKAAEMLKVGRATVQEAKAILENAPHEVAAIERGEKTINEVKRELRKAEIVKKVAALPSDKFRVIYADPPWKYGDTRELDGWEATAAEDHYPTMSIADLCAMPIIDIVEKDAVLFMWVTSPLLDECWPVIKAWGFDYRASFVWDKVKHNVGNYNSVRHEFLLVCIRGSCTPDVKKLHDSVVSIPRTKHSQKPEEFRAYIDQLYPHGKRIELFARKKTKGWEAYGNQAYAKDR